MSSGWTAALACTFVLGAAPALAQGYGATGTTQSTTGGMQTMQSSQGMQGSHEMPGTVTSIDKTAGMIDVRSEGKSLRLHFPPSALANIKTGDKIKVQLSLTKT